MITKYRYIFYIFSLLLVIFSIYSLSARGLNLGIDFQGGSLLEVAGEVDKSKLPEDLGFSIQKTQNNTILRFSEVSESKHQEIISAIGNEELRFESIGPTIGQELKQKALWAISLVLILIIFYIAWAFRKIKQPFKYGSLAIIALAHDILITLGIFSFFNIEINTAFIVAILTILGYSVNDTIVVFDRVRENVLKDIENPVDISIKQSIRRSLFTSITTLLVLFSIFFFGGATIKDFVLALIIGIIAGTYSSLFLASPLLVSWRKSNNEDRD